MPTPNDRTTRRACTTKRRRPRRCARRGVLEADELCESFAVCFGLAE